MRQWTRAWLRALGSGALLTGLSVAALAQVNPAPPGGTESDQQALGEVVVTAQRREENIQNVPLAVTALSAAQLEQAGATSALDVARLVPNMFGSNNTGLGTANVYSIRGLNNTESIATFDAPVGTYVDEVFLARQNANNYSLFDVDHIEVLRGPQGTLFGRNTTGGAVSIVLRKPGAELGGYAEAGYGSYAQRFFRGSIDLPLSPSLLTKVSAFYVKDDGYVTDLTTHQRLNGNDEKGVRAAVRWLPSDALTWDLSADYIDQNYMNILNTPDSRKDRFSRVGLNTDFSEYPNVYSGPKSDYPLGNRVLSHSITSNVTWRTELGTVNFITGWRDLTQKFFIDFFDSPLPVVQNGGANGGEFVIDNEGRHRQISQEIKLAGTAMGDRLTYVTGLFYLNEMNRTDLGQGFFLPSFGLPAGLCLNLPGVGGLCGIPTATAGLTETSFSSFFYDRTLDNATHSFAVYGQGDLKLLDPLTLTVGARYTDETKSLSYTPNPNPYAPASNQFSTADIGAAGIPTRQQTRIVTPRVALRWDFSADVNAYVSATKGFKGGGWNARSSTADLVLPFSPEKTWSYEAGLRSEWFEHRARANITAFYSETRDYQLPTAFVPPGGGGDVFITGNYAGLVVHGVEAELATRPVRDLNVFANIGWQQGRYQFLSTPVLGQQQRCLAELAAGTPKPPDCGQGIVNSAGGIAEPVRLPRFNIKAGLAYTVHFGALDVTPNALLEDVGQFELDTAEALPNSRNHGYAAWDANVMFAGNAGAHEHLQLTAGCINCSDRIILASKLPPTLYYQEPRRWQVLLRYQY